MKFLLRFLGYFILWTLFGGIATAFMISFMGFFYWALPATVAPDLDNLDLISLIYWMALICGLVGGFVKAKGLELLKKLGE